MANSLAAVDLKEMKTAAGMEQDAFATSVTTGKLNFALLPPARFAVLFSIPSTFLCGERRRVGAGSERGSIPLQPLPNQTIIRITTASPI